MYLYINKLFCHSSLCYDIFCKYLSKGTGKCYYLIILSTTLLINCVKVKAVKHAGGIHKLLLSCHGIPHLLLCTNIIFKP